MINELLHELGVSKVRLAKFLGVSRQMVYNYLENDDINKWPKEKRIKFFELLGVKTASEISNLKVNSDYIVEVENKLNKGVKNNVTINSGSNKISNVDISSFNKRDKNIINDFNVLLKEMLEDDKNNENYLTLKYLYDVLKGNETSKEVKYICAYFSKAFGFTDPNEFKFDIVNQPLFEGIVYSALSMYKGKGFSKSKVEAVHKKFVLEVERKKEEQLGKTQELMSAKVQALRELGFDKITNENSSVVFNKITEILSRTV